MANAPVMVKWDGEVEAFIPLPYFLKRCNATYVDGERYRMEIAEERSEASHGHFFARLQEQWASLPDHMLAQFPTYEILRKHALCMTGFRRERKYVAASHAEARKLAAWLRPTDMEDDFAIISVHENTVVEWKPLSQSKKGMPTKGQFQASKRAVLDWVDDLLGVHAAKAEAA
jgi:hypothetical protein